MSPSSQKYTKQFINSKLFIFPVFHFEQSHDVIDVHAGEISWKFLPDAYDKHKLLQSNLKKRFQIVLQIIPSRR